MKKGWLVLLLGLVGCTHRTEDVNPLGPSPLSLEAPTRVVLVLDRQTITVKVRNLREVRQVEGVLEWADDTARQAEQAFSRCEWWFDNTYDWEWVVYEFAPTSTYFGMWRENTQSGDGVVGMLHYQPRPQLVNAEVWLDGMPASVEIREKEVGFIEGLLPMESLKGDWRGRQGLDRGIPDAGKD